MSAYSRAWSDRRIAANCEGPQHAIETSGGSGSLAVRTGKPVPAWQGSVLSVMAGMLEPCEYKCQRYGRQFTVIDRWYPSSKTCSACGHLLADLSLATRHWTCPSCGTRHDRDMNAAKNILAAGQAVAACGAGVRHSWIFRVQSAMKQEPGS
jgi:DNA-directed RNA polymerase subunit RPC12/RpoP